MPLMRIKSSIHDYSVKEVPSLREAIARLPEKQKIYALVDQNLLRLHHDQLSGLDPERMLVIDATETQKSLENLPWIFSWLLEHGFRRDCELLAIGGGVVQDTSCFIASVLLRGVRWHFIPTTLLAQCDSCIGSKSSINIGKFKNQIGNFYPPHEVSLIGDLLQTLPYDEIRSGLGEAIKLHLLSSEEDFLRLRSTLSSGPLSHSILAPVVHDSLRIKQRFIELDEFDKGPRNLLNYGHTFGHAYESATAYGIPHGIAVTLGVATATFISERLGLAPNGHFAEVSEFLRPFYEPYHHRIKELELEPIVAAMKLDKKNTSGVMNCILTRGYGCMEKRGIDPERELLPLLCEFLQTLA